MMADDQDRTIGDELGDRWADADTKGVGRAETLRMLCEQRQRGELPGEEWEKTVGGAMARGRWVREQLEREAMGLPVEEFNLAAGLEEVEADLQRVELEEKEREFINQQRGRQHERRNTSNHERRQTERYDDHDTAG